MNVLPGLSRAEILRYSRHLLLPEVGLQGQKKLKAASALVIGAGGLGSPVALYLAAAGVGRIGLVDNDTVDPTNLQRQVIHGTTEVGALKVKSARRRMLDLNPEIQVEAFDQAFTAENALHIAASYDLLLDCSDNFPTRYLVNDLCVLTGKADVSGSVYRLEGQVSVYDARRGPCYRCLFPEPPPPHLVTACAEGGILGVLPGTIGTLQATEALKLILGIGEPLTGRLMIYNALDMSVEVVKLRKNPHCKVCGPEPEITTLIDSQAACGTSEEVHEIEEMTAAALAEKIGAQPAMRLIDVREPHEQEISRLPGAQLIPLGQLASRLAELDPAQEVIVFCRTGIRSARAAELLLAAGFRQVRHLKGGINAWAREVDPSLPVY